MYGKCGNLDSARSVFERIQKRDVFTWNSLIVGYGVHGRGDEAISFFGQMLMVRVQPNSVTFLGLLCGCSHQGLVEKGVEYFHVMSSKFNIKPGIKHYGCLVDLFGRAGMLEKALQVIRNSRAQDDPVLWQTLLGSCKIHKNVEIGEIAMRNLIQLGSSNPGDYVLLATIYLREKDADGVARRMRKLIKTQEVKTTPGWSWIEVGDQVHKFVVGDKSHPDANEIYQKLRSTVHQAALHGYVQEESLITVSEFTSTDTDCSETSSSCHSEKLTIAFGLVRTPKRTCLRIVKNLRVCRDFHSQILFPKLSIEK